MGRGCLLPGMERIVSRGEMGEGPRVISSITPSPPLPPG